MRWFMMALAAMFVTAPLPAGEPTTIDRPIMFTDRPAGVTAF